MAQDYISVLLDTYIRLLQ